MIATFVFLFCLFLTYAGYVLVTSKSDARSDRLQQRVAEALRDSSAAEYSDVQLSRKESMSSNPLLNRLLAPLNFAKKLERMISQADMQITVGRLLMFCLFAFIMATLAAYTILNSSLMIVALGLIAASLPILHVTWTRKKRLRKFMEHLPDALDLMSRSLAVGHAFSESLHQVAMEMPEPISTEFRMTYEEQKLGLSTKAALGNLAERIPLLDLRLCITAVMIQRETGGNLAEILEKVSHTMRERFKLMEELRTLTTASRGSAWILCILPIAIIFMLTAINPKHMGVLFYDKRGQYILLAAGLMQIIGMLTIRKIMAVKI